MLCCVHVLRHGSVVERSRRALHHRNGAPWAMPQAGAQAVTVGFRHHAGFAVDDANGPLLARGHAQTAAVTFRFVDFNDISQDHRLVATFLENQESWRLVFGAVRLFWPCIHRRRRITGRVLEGRGRLVLLQQVPDGEHRVSQEHLRARVPHDLADLIPHGRFIAMNRAVRADRFVFAPGTFAQPSLGVLEQR